MPTIKYDIGEPTTELRGFTHYVDLYTDTMYKWQDNQWVVIMKRGMPIDEHGNVIVEPIGSYD